MNFANKLTLARIGLLPFLILFMYLDNFYTRIFALIIFIAAAITDIYDGMIARKYNTITTLGIFLDPLADKLIISAALISFVGLKELSIPAWMVILITSREFIITGLRSLAASKNVIIPADKSGKLKTTSQIVSIIILMLILIVDSALWRYYGFQAPALYLRDGMAHYAGWVLIKLPFWLMLFTTALTLYSGLSYLYKHREILK
ncbi:MAG TPA: CDP-diacylglycerol--glycerol-3-phosphate 3-phosphatidyltransferase [Elusimicrobia bacterium]|nr:MAG: CDP-diacylglycerol--glycerol-3-phosphate 3-phosphatidyltransferase [Elusimicrobia bacterium RIFOXYA12_FULL_49_49]OGS09470.1 MAG: CDP-diacylglycerol--glycerol-3-phosphate 3-phosphatidyltransferase [Elusimicrobia bacterium RIFOXYA1_FULL_47_7]OGS11255.1 MAG: CDP-diacylglycerol--glycerol-3-phosphate 3-phosphatidyltransferase [Elusimicrobia bacterium RIFOXYB1_FULL_48_9]OGS15653.1 MAG: CDP-diacylglycerol--glycerol-3-phosphate 3-phosphatidyltransferase [Elusimicrobia bacterium RIFOXYA2_FULL_47_